MKLIVLLVILLIWVFLLNIGKIIDLIADFIFKKLEPHLPALQATYRWCDAQKAFREWQEKNPFESENHPEAQKLLLTEAGAYILFLGTHSYIDGREQLKTYMERIDDWRFS